MARTKADQPAEFDKTESAEAAAVAAEGTAPDLVEAARKRAEARSVKDPAERTKAEVDALLIERRGYVQRVALVDRELERRGFTGDGA